MVELIFTLVGVLLGFLLTISYEWLKNRSLKRNAGLLLRGELEGNIARLKEVLEIIAAYADEPLPEYIKPLTINEIAGRIETACQRESFEALRRDLPLLGAEAMDKVIDFYESSRLVPRTFRDIERWAGNIRAHLFEDNIQFLIEKADAAVRAIGA